MGQTPKTRRDGWTVERQLRFLDVLARKRSVTRAAQAAGMSRESAYRLRGRDALFSALWNRAVKGHKVELDASRYAWKNRRNPAKVTKWKKWKDLYFQSFDRQLRELLLSGEQGPDHHREADERDGPDDRADDRNSCPVERQVNDPRAEPDPAAKRGPRARLARDHYAQQRDNCDREGLLEIGLRADQPAGDRIGLGQALVASADVPLTAVLRRLVSRRDEDVDEQQQRAEREDRDFNRHRLSLLRITAPAPYRSPRQASRDNPACSEVRGSRGG